MHPQPSSGAPTRALQLTLDELEAALRAVRHDRRSRSDAAMHALGLSCDKCFAGSQLTSNARMLQIANQAAADAIRLDGLGDRLEALADDLVRRGGRLEVVR